MPFPRPLIASIGLVGLLLGCAGSATPATCVPMGVHPVRFSGNVALTADELEVPFQSLERMQLPWPTLVTTAFADALSAAVYDLRDLLEDRGYVDATVRDVIYLPSPDRRWIDVAITIDEGKRYKLGSIRLREKSGEALLIDGATLEGLLGLKEGDWFSRRALDVAMSAVLGAYAERGVGARAFAYKTTGIVEGVVDVDIELRRQSAIDRVAKIEVEGAESPERERVIARALELEIGDRLDPVRLEDAERRLRATGDFAHVEVFAQDGLDQPEAREVVVVVGPLVPLPP